MTQKTVRTRFAPSPTGPLHIGGVRTALFSWLLARHHGGKFILRIEDTDQKRFVEGSIELITDALSWLGIDYDEGPDKDGGFGPYIQSERLPLYHKWAQWLLDNDKAYRCFCSSERLDQVNKDKMARKEPSGYDRLCRTLSKEEIEKNLADGKTYTIRLKVPLDGQTIGHDIIRGEVVFDNDTLQDAVMLKTDGFPTYHLANVIDDHFMEI
ncbi:MAG TPA: glutamate--tRNA ligase family protein, partial [Aggregatilineales bacterium]|nr:glutamate--tRNA ligase family protein [Aggregatilineales bacterium]